HRAVRQLLEPPLDRALVGIVEGREGLARRRLVGRLATEAHIHALVAGRQSHRNAGMALATPEPVVFLLASRRVPAFLCIELREGGTEDLRLRRAGRHRKPDAERRQPSSGHAKSLSLRNATSLVA